jgi:hypothetical protein
MAVMGAPTKYKPEYCQQIVAFFSNVPTVQEIINKKIEKGLIEFPTFEKFAVSINVHVDTMIEWAKEHENFSESYKKCKHLQKAFLIQMGLNGLYAPAAFCFVAKNCTDMRDKTEVEHTGLPEPPKELTIRIAKD